MNRILLSITVLLIGSFFVQAQEKELTLEDAVLQQYRAFRPEGLPMLKWVPGTKTYSYLEGYRVLKLRSIDEKDSVELSIDELNESLEAELKWFSGFDWFSKNVFTVNDGLNYYKFNIKTGEGEKVLTLDKGAENTVRHPKTSHVAFTIKNDVYIRLTRGQTLRVTDNLDKNIVSGQPIARSEFGIKGGLFWSNKGEFLAFYQKDETDVHDYPLLDITETPGSLKPIKYPMAGQTSEKARIGIYNTTTRTTVYIEPKGDEDDYLTNITFSADDKFLIVAEVNRGQNHMWLNVYDALTGEFVKTLFEESNEKWIEPEHPPYFLSARTNEFIWISERDGYNNLYHYDFDGQLIKQLTSNEFVVKSIESIDKKGKQIYFTATGSSPLNAMLYTVDLDGDQKQLTKDEGVHKVSISSRGYILDAYSNHSTPGVTQILDKKGELEKVLLTSENKLIDYKIGSADISTITADEGSTLYTRLIKPSDFDSTKTYPVLVYVYGGPHAQLITNSWLDGASLWMYWMAEQGYLIYTVDNRGSAHRGTAFEQQIHRQLGTLEIEDQMSGVAYLKTLPFVDGERIAVHGWSFGGFMTSSLMLRESETFKVGVAGGPVTDWKYYEVMYGERYMDQPEENPEGYEQASLMTHAGNLKGNLLLIHGTNDDVVVMQHNLALVKKFVDLGIQMDFFPYPMHPHNVRGKDRVHLMTKVLNYIIENNQ